MATESVLQNLATQLTAAAQLDALNLIYARQATLPTGAATSALQGTGNTSLASIDTKTPALSSGRVPVTIDPSQIAAITPPAAITGYATETTLSALNGKTPALVSGSVPVTQITGYATETTSAAQLALDTAGIRGIRRDADTSPVADAQSHTLTTNAVGRLKTSTWPGAYALSSGNITATAQNVAVDVSRVSNATVEIVGTFTGLAVAFESSLDGTNWKAEQGLRSNGVAIESTGTALATGMLYTWEFSVNGKNWFRVRSTAFTSGTATVQIAFGAFATEPFVSTPTHSVQQSGAWTVAATTATGTPFTLASAATTNATSLKTSAGSLFEVTTSNHTGTTAYLKLYNKASAPTVGTDVPVLTIPIATGTSFVTDFGAIGKRFATGIAYAVTGGTGIPGDTTAAPAGIQISGTYV